MMPMPRRMRVLLCMLALAASPLLAQPSVESVGPRVGAAVPDFSGVDQFGRHHTLKSIAGPKGAMLVFFRSADW